MSDTAWRRLGRAIQIERARLGYRSAAELAAAAGLSTRTVEQIESGTHPGRPRETTLARIEGVLGPHWDGMATRILEGRRPKHRADPLLDRVAAAWPRLTDEAQRTIVVVVETIARQRGPR